MCSGCVFQLVTNLTYECRRGEDHPEFVWPRSVPVVLDSASRESGWFVVSLVLSSYELFTHPYTGITLEATFSRRSTHLLCPSGTGAKFEKALEWRIPVVSLAWLEDIARTGSLPRVDEYPASESHARAVDEDNGFGRSRHTDAVLQSGKGKGKEKEVDCQMMDITNGSCIPFCVVLCLFPF